MHLIIVRIRPTVRPGPKGKQRTTSRSTESQVKKLSTKPVPKVLPKRNKKGKLKVDLVKVDQHTLTSKKSKD